VASTIHQTLDIGSSPSPQSVLSLSFGGRQGLADIARHVIQRIANPRLLVLRPPYDVEINIHYDPRHQHPAKPRFLSYIATYDVARNPPGPSGREKLLDPASDTSATGLAPVNATGGGSTLDPSGEARPSYVRISYSHDTYERIDTEVAKLGLRGVTVWPGIH